MVQGARDGVDMAVESKWQIIGKNVCGNTVYVK